MDNKVLYYIWLSTSLRPGSKTPKILFRHFGSIDKIYAAEKDDYKSLEISQGEIAALTNKDLDIAKKCYDYCMRSNVGFLCYEDPYYPERLKIIDNPPAMFYYKGRLIHFDDNLCITMVGTRSCSERGFRMAYNEGFSAACKGAVVVNGLALGIDGACIAGALDAEGYAIGLLGCGIDRVYPEGNRDLFKRLSEHGLILSEFAPFTKPIGSNFPIRNRVLSALSVATVVFEAGEGSGALITARHAIEQGRRIFAVPGKPYDKNYAGPLELIKDGATVFTEADDVLSEYSMSFPHRINLANTRKPSSEKLDKYVSRYFKKDTDPDTPVNRRYAYKSGPANQQNNSTSPETKVVEAEPIIKKEDKTPFIEKRVDVSDTQKEKSVDLSLFSTVEIAVYETVKKNGSMTPDEITAHGFKIDEVLAALTILEIYGLVAAEPGGKYKA
ncbi:MAG: DNA-protecting protein DprA [Ruminococcaceae bacterium]|nr:DNA-protecting protein DprA [Oscillospiraceae bacterium]